MKISLNNIMVFLMAVCMSLTSCSPQGDEPAKTSFEVAPLSLTLDPQGGQEFITVTSNEDWLMRSDVKWVKVVTSSGKASSDPVKASITFEANTESAARQGTITVKTLKGKGLACAVIAHGAAGKGNKR